MAKPKPERLERQRRSVDQRIAELAAKIDALKEREAKKQAKADPVLRHASAALRSLDKALAVTDDAVTRSALNEVRATLSRLGLEPAVLVPQRTRRARADTEELAAGLLAYVQEHPGQRGEQIAAALGTDTDTMRPVMKRLIAEGKVATQGQRRGMTYAPA